MRLTTLAAVIRHEPYRLFFPLGALLGIAGVGWWLVYFASMAWSASPLIYRGHEHALVQAQGFIMAFAFGFLGTMLPRRTKSAPPSVPGLVVTALALVVMTAATLARHPLVAEVSALLAVGYWLVFALARLRPSGAGRRAPDAFVMIPVAFAQSFLGALLLVLASFGVVGSRGVTVASGLLLEGALLALVMGVGRFVLPVLHGHEVPPDADNTPASRRARAGWTTAGLLLVASFPLQQIAAERWDPVTAIRMAYALRGLLALAALLATRAWQWPAKPGTQRRLLWISAWLVPPGFLLAASFPSLRLALLHVTFIGGFGLLALAVGAHVTLGHGGHERLASSPSWALRWFGALVLLSVTVRVSADVWPDAYWIHLAGAAGTWVVGLIIWMVFLIPKALGPRGDGAPIVPNRES